eukprot:g39670.t1
MGPTLVHSRIPCKTQWSRPPLRQPRQNQKSFTSYLYLGGHQNSWAHGPDSQDRTVLTRRWSGMYCLSARTSLETPVNRNSDQVTAGPTQPGRPNGPGTGTQTALHGLIREPTNTPEILSPTTKTPTQCFILSRTTKWLPRYGDCTITYSHAIPYANQTSRPYLAAPAARVVPHLSALHLTGNQASTLIPRLQEKLLDLEYNSSE